MLGSGTERVSARGSQLRPRNEDITETGTPFLAVALIQRSISKWLPDELPAPRANSVTIIGNLFCADCLCFHLHPHPRSYHDPPFCRSAAIIAAVFLPVATQAQGVPGGVERGARDGERAARTSRPSLNVISVTPCRMPATLTAGGTPIWNENG